MTKKGVPPSRAETPKVERHAADQEAGLHIGVFENPGQHRSGRCFAMRAGNTEHPAVMQHMFGQPLRAGDIGQAFVEHSFKQRVATRNGVADDENVGLQRQLAKVEAFNQFNARSAKLVAHRRIDVGVAARDLVTGGNRQLGDAAHEGAADTQNMNVHVT
jgi:hypothetical protein